MNGATALAHLESRSADPWLMYLRATSISNRLVHGTLRLPLSSRAAFCTTGFEGAFSTTGFAGAGALGAACSAGAFSTTGFAGAAALAAGALVAGAFRVAVPLMTPLGQPTYFACWPLRGSAEDLLGAAAAAFFTGVADTKRLRAAGACSFAGRGVAAFAEGGVAAFAGDGVAALAGGGVAALAGKALPATVCSRPNSWSSCSASAMLASMSGEIDIGRKNYKSESANQL